MSVIVSRVFIMMGICWNVWMWMSVWMSLIVGMECVRICVVVIVVFVYF